MWSLALAALAAPPAPVVPAVKTPLPPPEETACSQGVGAACTALGHAYLVGDGVPVDRFRAVQLFRQGCELSDAPACMWLAEAYRTGEGMRLDVAQAIDLYQRACELRNAIACRSVGDLYTMGAIGPADGRSAGVWYLMGCELDDAQSCTAAALWVERGDGAAPDPTKALALFGKACRGGHPRGCTMLGDRYLRGSDGAPRDPLAAYEWYRLGCTAPFDPESCRIYGAAEVKGRPVPKAVDQGIAKLDRACYMNDALACRLLAQALDDADRGAEALMAGERGCDMGDRTACLVASRVRARLARDLTP